MTPNSSLNRRAGTAVATLALSLASAGCASAVTYNPGHVPADGMRRIVDACAMVARLPGGSVYDLNVCEESLSRSLAGRLASERLIASRQACLAQGAPAGSAALSGCELDRRGEGVAASSRPLESVPRMTAADLGVGPRASRRDREEHACAAIGFEPAGGGFGQCVADLDAELFAADRPIM